MIPSHRNYTKSCIQSVTNRYITVVAALLALSAPSVSSAWDWSAESSNSGAIEIRPINSTDEVQRFEVRCLADSGEVRFVFSQTPSRPNDDYRATAEIASSIAGGKLALRLTLPHEADPRTGRPLQLMLAGSRLRAPAKVESLLASGNAQAVQQAIRKARTELSQPKFDDSEAFITATEFSSEVRKGVHFFELGKVKYGPVVATEMAQPHSERSQVPGIRVGVDHDQLHIADRPACLRLLPDHGEPISFFRDLGANAVWVSDANDTERMEALISNGIAVMATPPHPDFDEDDFRSPGHDLPPLDKTHPHVSAWYLGTQVGSDQLQHLLAWARKVRSADRKSPRPLMGDVRSREGVASRQIDFIGISQQMQSGVHSFGHSRNASFRRQHASSHLILPWQWVQTQGHAKLNAWRRASKLDLAVSEPEQILMQTAVLISSGCRGAGFWKSESMLQEDGQKSESALAAELSMLYLQILEPFLVKGRVEGHVPITINQKSAVTRNPLQSPGILPVSYIDSGRIPDAAVINSDGTSIIFSTFWDEFSHLVPQQLHASTATITVSAPETASAWQVRTTGLKGLRRLPTAGGLKLNIADFDLMSICLVSSSRESISELEKRIHQHGARASRLFVALAERKLNRTAATSRIIDQLAPANQSFDAMSSTTVSLLRQAQSSLSLGDYVNAERLARSSMRATRSIQTRYWQAANRNQISPHASPHTTNFSTLPDHWRMMTRVQSHQPSENLVPSGSFDDRRQLAESLWQPIPALEEDYRTNADVVSDFNRNNQVLWLRSERRHDRPIASDTPSMLVRSPEVQAQAGAIYEITGRAKLGQAVITELAQPFSIFDSDLGPDFAVKPQLRRSWREFRILRQASTDGPMKVWLAVHGAAEVFVDNLAVRMVAPPERESASDQKILEAGYSGPSSK